MWMRLTSIGVLVVVMAWLGTVPLADVRGAPVNCTKTCSQTQFQTNCNKSTYSYTTKQDCTFCNGNTSPTYCTDLSLPNNCQPTKDDKVRWSVVTVNSDLCPCTHADGTQFKYAESNKLTEKQIEGLVLGQEVTRYTCQAP